MFDKFLLWIIWGRSLDAEAETYAQKEGCREIKWQHRVRAGLNSLNYALLIVLSLPFFNLIFNYFSIKIRGYYVDAFWVADVFFVFVLSRIIGKIRNLLLLAFCTFFLMVIFAVLMHYSLTHYIDMFKIENLIY